MVKLVFDFIAYASDIAAAWDGIRVLDVRHSGELAAGVTGEPFRVEVTVDTVLYIASGCRTALICASAYKKNSARVRRFFLYVVLSRIISSG